MEVAPSSNGICVPQHICILDLLKEMGLHISWHPMDSVQKSSTDQEGPPVDKEDTSALLVNWYILLTLNLILDFL